MSREKKFHTLIEQQNCEEKERLWNKLKTELDLQENNATIELSGSQAVLSIRAKRILPFLFAGFILFFVIVLSVSLLQRNNKKNNIRYCSKEDYTVELADITLAEFSLQINADLLYFDWYEETEYIFSSLLRLKETEEVISFSELIMDMEEGYIIKLSVTENINEIDVYSMYEDVCSNVVTQNSIQVSWGVLNDNSVACFEYEHYKYYLEVLDSVANDDVLKYVEKLLP